MYDVDKELYLFFVGPSTDEQNLSKKSPVICQDVKASSSAKPHHKGTLELKLCPLTYKRACFSKMGDPTSLV